jgi:hypothetical protein
MDVHSSLWFSSGFSIHKTDRHDKSDKSEISLKEVFKSTIINNPSEGSGGSMSSWIA